MERKKRMINRTWKWKKNNCRPVSESIFFQAGLSFSCLSFPTGCSLQCFHFPWQNFHWSFLQLDIPHFCLLPGDKYWISYSPGDCCLGYKGKGTLSELIFCSEFSEIILCLTCLWFFVMLEQDYLMLLHDCCELSFYQRFYTFICCSSLP